MASENLSGNDFVRAIRPAFNDVNALVRNTRDKAEIRRQALKLRYWPSPLTTEDSGQVIDLDWSMIRALPGLKVGE